MRKTATLLLLLFLSFPVSAQEQVPPAPTRIEADSESDEIRFFVDDELSAVLDKNGFRVLGDITYGGVMRDGGDDSIFKPSDDEQGAQTDAP